VLFVVSWGVGGEGDWCKGGKKWWGGGLVQGLKEEGKEKVMEDPMASASVVGVGTK